MPRIFGPRIFGLDIGTTSIGFAVIDCDFEHENGRILRLGTRIFPEARDPDGTPKNQERRQKRMMRRQCRRRRERRKLLNEILLAAGLLPAFGSADWPQIMMLDPYALRDRGIDEELAPHEIGRMIYHLAKHRHFKGRDIDDGDEDDEKEAKTERETTLASLKAEGVTLGQWLSQRTPKRGKHAARSAVEDEFERLWTAQSAHHPSLLASDLKARVFDAAFTQRPVFWRRNTLGKCRFEPEAELCPKGSWLSQQRRMLEKLNNLTFAHGNKPQLDDEERAAILDKLRSQATMSWGGVREALKPLYKARGEAGAERSVRFNLELGGDKGLIGNLVESKLVAIFGDAWASHPHRQAIRDATHERLWKADYGEIGSQRVVIRSQAERKAERAKAAQSFIADFAVTPEQAAALEKLTFPPGWEPFSVKALRQFLPHLEDGVRFGTLVNGSEAKWVSWRNETFPNREQPTGEFHDRLPSPSQKEEAYRIAQVRNPTVVRTQNELRKVINNLIGLFGKPDLIRVELARDVGKSKRERDEIQTAIRKQEGRRKKATEDLQSKGIAEPSRDDVEKWLLWKECGETCPYSGDKIGFDALFRTGEFEVEHIWPRSRSLDDSFRNKTLCRKEINLAKGNQTPFEHFKDKPDEWAGIQQRLNGMVRSNGMSQGKVRRFLAEQMPDDFTTRQLNDTGYAARQAVGFLKLLWPDAGPDAPVFVQAVTGRVTAQLRKVWGLNNILSDSGEKTRADHRHHAIDALVVACAHGGYTQKLSAYFKARKEGTRPPLAPPWANIRKDAEAAVAEIIVSHRVRKKVSGPLHKETVYGDTGENVTTGAVTYRLFVTRKKVEALSKPELEFIRDEKVKAIVTEWVQAHGGDPKKAFATDHPRLGDNGQKIHKVRLLVKQQVSLMAPVSTGYADLGNNHHITIYRRPNGKAEFEVVSLFEASRRLVKREPVIRRHHPEATFVMSLSPGDAVEFPEETRGGHLRIVQSIWASGVIVTVGHRDASGASVWRPNAGSIVKGNAKKISIDPIGRLRKAND